MNRVATLRSLAVVALLCSAACATTPTPPAPDPHRYVELIPGSSTTADAIGKLGPPSSQSSVRDQTLLQWIDVYSGHPIHVAILFGRDDRMVKVDHVFNQ